MDHVGIVVDDLASAKAFFVELGLKLQGEGTVEGGWVDRVVGLEGVRAELAMMETPDGHGRLELVKFHAPSGAGGEGVSDRRAGVGRSEQLDRPPPAAMTRRCGPSRRHRPGRGANPDAERSSTTSLRRAPEASRPA
jgi:catechol 2,3-dioxygenase-like lactoylglutathione lyase family enzyme